MSRDVVKTIITCENRRLPIWNINNTPTGSDGAGGELTSLLSCIDISFFVGGDFNLRHPLWDSSVLYARRSCSDLIDWYESRGLKLLNPTETPTHNRGGTLDLAFCSDNNAKCEVCLDLHSISDRETLVTTLSWTTQNKGVNKLQYRSLDNKLFVQLLGTSHPSVPILSQDDLEIEASNIVETLRTALSGACPRKRARRYGTPWWNDEYRSAAHSYRRARRESPVTWKSSSFKKAYGKQKKAYWNSVIAETKSLPEAYKIVRWHNAASRYQSPPLRYEEGSEVIHDPQEKARLLHRALLYRHLEAEDILLKLLEYHNETSRSS
ncbi:hypothetical protein K3495_g7583 [Podosphaera aphanis]|nr:hypothetical protein K3495_g7583 [Podosphaera aphanis]